MHDLTSLNYKHCETCREYNKQYRNNIPRKYKQGHCSSEDGISKKCSDCLETKYLNCFYKHSRYKDGHRNQCIECHSSRWKKYYNNGYDKVLKEKLLNDAVYKLKQNQRTYLHQQLRKQGLKKNANTKDYIGCSADHLKRWLTFQFETGMSWENKRWHVDHVIPVSLFNLNNEDERQMAFHWTNLQPLSQSDNQIKYNKFIPVQYCNSLIAVCRFIRQHKINDVAYYNIRKRMQWVQQNFSLQHFQIAGTP
jgi:hypothetical protein